jgi:enoyl-[acyl-carrier protein] reductase I
MHLQVAPGNPAALPAPQISPKARRNKGAQEGTMPAGLMAGRRGLIMGVANEKSIAWGIAQACRAQGAELAFTYQGEALKKRVEPLAASLDSDVVLPCDVGDAGSIDAVFAALGQRWDRLDFLLHAIAYADKAELKGRYVDTSAENFARSLNISCYSFTAVAQRAEKMMGEGGSLLTLTYYGAEKVMPHYNVMGIAKAALETSVRYMAMDLGPQGIRVNALSAGPIRTLAASGIGDFRYILKWNELNSPLRRNVTQDEIGRAGMYLLSELSSGVTGECHHVDCGYHVVGMKAEDAPDIDVAVGRSTSDAKNIGS